MRVLLIVSRQKKKSTFLYDSDLKEGIFIICYSAVLIITFLFIILFASKNATLQPRAFFNLFFQIHL